MAMSPSSATISPRSSQNSLVNISPGTNPPVKQSCTTKSHLGNLSKAVNVSESSEGSVILTRDNVASSETKTEPSKRFTDVRWEEERLKYISVAVKTAGSISGDDLDSTDGHALREYELTDYINIESSSQESLRRDTSPETAVSFGQSMTAASQASLT